MQRAKKVIPSNITMIDLNISKLLMVVGPSCAGKSSLIEVILDLYPNFQVWDDLSSLKELFTIEDIVNISLQSGQFERAAENLRELRKESEYYTDLLEKWLEIFKGSESKIRLDVSTMPTENGGHEIIEPRVWDEIIDRVTKKIKEKDNCIVQFSRGYDKKYLKWRRVSPKDIYRIPIEIILDNLNTTIIKRAGILHVTAPFNIRNRRNENRARHGGHYVDKKVMQTTYKEDPFVLMLRKCEGSKGYIEVGSHVLPVYTFDNRKDMVVDENNNIFMNEIREMFNYFDDFQTT